MDLPGECSISKFPVLCVGGESKSLKFCLAGFYFILYNIYVIFFLVFKSEINSEDSLKMLFEKIFTIHFILRNGK